MSNMPRTEFRTKRVVWGTEKLSMYSLLSLNNFNSYYIGPIKSVPIGCKLWGGGGTRQGKPFGIGPYCPPKRRLCTVRRWQGINTPPGRRPPRPESRGVCDPVAPQWITAHDNRLFPPSFLVLTFVSPGISQWAHGAREFDIGCLTFKLDLKSCRCRCSRDADLRAPYVWSVLLRRRKQPPASRIVFVMEKPPQKQFRGRDTDFLRSWQLWGVYSSTLVTIWGPTVFTHCTVRKEPFGEFNIKRQNLKVRLPIRKFFPNR